MRGAEWTGETWKVGSLLAEADGIGVGWRMGMLNVDEVWSRTQSEEWINYKAG